MPISGEIRWTQSLFVVPGSELVRLGYSHSRVWREAEEAVVAEFLAQTFSLF